MDVHAATDDAPMDEDLKELKDDKANISTEDNAQPPQEDEEQEPSHADEEDAEEQGESEDAESSSISPHSDTPSPAAEATPTTAEAGAKDAEKIGEYLD